MEFLNVKCHLAFLDQLVVEFVPSCQTGELGTWKVRNGMEV